MFSVHKLADWDIIKKPSVPDPIHYFSILKNKREFAQLVKEYDSRIFKYGPSHYCCIVPRSSLPEKNGENEFCIFLFDEIHELSFIGFRIKANKDTFLYEVKLLILFLESSNNAISYQMKNNCIHVKCKRNTAWELFYSLYAQYLKRYMLTVIGTQFFYSFFYSYFIEKEKLLLQMLFRGSKIVNISKKSVFYKIHRKRKLSVTDLLYTNYNMPKTEEYFKNKKQRLDSCAKSSLVTCGNKSMDSNGFRKVRKRHRKFLSPSKSYPQIESSSLSHKLCKDSLHLHNKRNYINQWEKYNDFKPNIIKSYSEIPQVKELILTLTKNVPKLDNFSESFSKIPGDALMTDKMKKAKETPLALKIVYIDQSCKQQEHLSNIVIHSDSKQFKYSNFSLDDLTLNNNKFQDSSKRIMSAELPQHFCKKLQDINSSDKSISLPPSANRVFPENECFSTASGKNLDISEGAMLTAQKLLQERTTENSEEEFKEGESDICQNMDYQNQKVFKTASCSLKKFKSNETIEADLITEEQLFTPPVKTYQACLEDVNFSTAAGKNISISKRAILSAYKVLEEVTVNESKKELQGIASDHFSTAAGKNINISKCAMFAAERVLEEGLINNSKQDFKKAVSDSSKNTKYPDLKASKIASCSFSNINQHYFEDESFSTAAGKNIIIPKASVVAAKKMLQEVMPDVEEQELNEKIPTDSSKSVNYQSQSATETDCLFLDNLKPDLDGNFIEKFFEVTCFDGKDLPSGPAPSKSSPELKRDRNTNIANRKPRKSLGGRRSIRFSDKL